MGCAFCCFRNTEPVSARLFQRKPTEIRQFLEIKRADIFYLNSSEYPTTMLDGVKSEIETSLPVEQYAVAAICSARQPEVSA